MFSTSKTKPILPRTFAATAPSQGDGPVACAGIGAKAPGDTILSGAGPYYVGGLMSVAAALGLELGHQHGRRLEREQHGQDTCGERE